MEQEILRKFEALCIQEEAPACQSSCPLHVDARAFIGFMQNKNLAKARQLLDKTLPLSMLTAFLCEGVCQEACRRSSIDQGLNLPTLERACVLNSQSAKIMPFPSTGKNMGLLGCGLSSFILAFELAKKGHIVTIYHFEEIGKQIEEKAKDLLPDNAISESIKVLKNLKVKFAEIKEIDSEILQNLSDNHLLLYLGFDDDNLEQSELLKKYIAVNPLTLLTEDSKVLAGGFKNQKFIENIADGKKAALSIERILQNVDPATAREKEAPYPTKLYTSLDNVVKAEAIVFQDEKNPNLEEAVLEAKRCIDCACLECVKQCSYLSHYKNYPKRYLREVYNNLAVVKGYRQANAMINSCTQCGLCEQICPKGLNMGQYLDIAKKEMVDTKRMPPAAHEFALDDMAFSNSLNIQFVRKQGQNQKNKYIFFPGCQLPTILPNQVMSAYAYLQENLEGGIGFHLGCCGIPAKWAGESKYLDKTLDDFKANWLELEKPIYIFACASCSDFFKTHCPEMEQISLWEIIQDTENNHLKSPENRLAGAVLDEVVAIHDPCSSRSFPKMQNSIRKLSEQIGQKYEELKFSKEMTRCCGYGGLSANVTANTKGKIADTFLFTRQKETDKILLVYCAICRERFQKIEQSSIHILELLFPFSEVHDIKSASSQKMLSAFERQEKRYEFKKNILEKFWGEFMSLTEYEIKINLSKEVEELIGSRHILKEDIILVLLEAKKDNSAFYNQETGHFLSAYRPRLVTYWVEYKEENDNSYTIINAYCHRMVVPGVSTENKQAFFTEACCTEKKED